MDGSLGCCSWHQCACNTSLCWSILPHQILFFIDSLLKMEMGLLQRKLSRWLFARIMLGPISIWENKNSNCLAVRPSLKKGGVTPEEERVSWVTIKAYKEPSCLFGFWYLDTNIHSTWNSSLEVCLPLLLYNWMLCFFPDYYDNPFTKPIAVAAILGECPWQALKTSNMSTAPSPNCIEYC